MIGETIPHYPPLADNVRAKHSKEGFSKDLSNEQKNASPLHENIKD